MTDGLALDIRQKLIQNGQTPPEMVKEAVRFMYAAEVVRSAKEGPDRPKDKWRAAHAYAAGRILIDMVGEPSSGIPQPLKDATEQIAPVFFEHMDKMSSRAEELGLVQG